MWKLWRGAEHDVYQVLNEKTAAVNLPTTLTGLFVFLVALIPGVPGEALFNRHAWQDWREETWVRVVRIVLISIFGLLAYSLISAFVFRPLLGGGLPLHVFPTTFTQSFSPQMLGPLAVGYLGHSVSALVVGDLSGRAYGHIAEETGLLKAPPVWDEFAGDLMHNRWIILELESGEVVAGIPVGADTEVPQSERDIVVREPAFWDPEKQTYIASPLQFYFVPAAHVQSVAVYQDKEQDAERITTPGEPIFSE